MICPHCSFDNPEGRKFCRACAKPLVPQLPATPPTPPRVTELPKTSELSTMAIASLVLSFFAFIVPFGVASIVMGHVARQTILKSRGALSGMGVAFAGLVMSYLQLGACLLVFLVLIAGIHRFNHELNRNPWDRAALVDVMRARDRELRTATAGEKHQREVVLALELIRDKQNAWITTHREVGYACNLSDLGYYVSEPSELGLHIRESHYEISIRECRALGEIRYYVMAVPRSNENPAGSPVFCLDQTDVIRKVDAAADIGCRTMGERVD